MNTGSKVRNFRQDLAILFFLTLPFLLNDFANIYVRDYRVWLAIDYVFVKVLPLAMIALLIRAGKISWGELGVKPIQIEPLMSWTLSMTFLGTILDQFGSRFFYALVPNTRIGGMPPITNPLVDQVDLYFGLMAVAVVEEIIFRGIYYTLLLRHISSVAGVIALSSIAFGLIHWSLGLSAVAHTSIIGAVFMVCLMKTKSVLPTIIAHFVVNYVAFSGVLNKP